MTRLLASKLFRHKALGLPVAERQATARLSSAARAVAPQGPDQHDHARRG